MLIYPKKAKLTVHRIELEMQGSNQVVKSGPKSRLGREFADPELFCAELIMSGPEEAVMIHTS